MTWLLSLFGPGGWIVAVGKFVLQHWKAFLVIAAVLGLLGYGYMRGLAHDRAKLDAVVAEEKQLDADWKKRWAVRDARDAEALRQHDEAVAALRAQNALIDAQAKADKAEREADYKKIEGKVKDYAARSHSNDCGHVGDDGLQLLLRSIRARHGAAGGK